MRAYAPRTWHPKLATLQYPTFYGYTLSGKANPLTHTLILTYLEAEDGFEPPFFR